MSRKNLVVALALAWLVAPLPAAAADYHHVHITTASPLQAVGWYCLLYTSPSPRDS